jgi:BirA family transcriptional regulator, biotin operon repressor / biotin---[acetyl-CoA-carboxylase] ligase
MPRDLERALNAAADRIAPFGGRVLHLEETGSTNDEAARLAAHGAPDGTLVVADAQTAGRGRLGRSWFSPPGAGLYASVVIRPRSTPASAVEGLLTLAGGVALAEGLRGATGLAVELKWPNDLMTPGGQRKLGGILTEGSSDSGGLAFIIFGFGINLTGSFDTPQGRAFDARLAGRATSLEAELGRPVDRSVVLVECLAALAARLRDLAEGRTAEIRRQWQQFAPSARGRAVEWTADAGRRCGVVEGIDDSGALLVRVGSSVERIISGEVIWL